MAIIFAKYGDVRKAIGADAETLWSQVRELGLWAGIARNYDRKVTK